MLEKPQRGFSQIELERRTSEAEALMAGENFSGVLLMSELDVRYFSGFQTLFW